MAKPCYSQSVVGADGRVSRFGSYGQPYPHQARPLYQVTSYSQGFSRIAAEYNFDLTEHKIANTNRHNADEWMVKACREKQLLTLVTVAEFNELETLRAEKVARSRAALNHDEAAISRMMAL